MLCVRAEDALAAAAAAAAASDKMRSVTLSAPALWLPPAICKHASSGLGVLLKVCSSSLGLRVCRGGSIQRAVRRMAGGGGRRSGGSARAGSGGGGAPASCSGVGSFLPDDQSPLSS